MQAADADSDDNDAPAAAGGLPQTTGGGLDGGDTRGCDDVCVPDSAVGLAAELARVAGARFAAHFAALLPHLQRRAAGAARPSGRAAALSAMAVGASCIGSALAPVLPTIEACVMPSLAASHVGVLTAAMRLLTSVHVVAADAVRGFAPAATQMVLALLYEHGRGRDASVTPSALAGLDPLGMEMLRMLDAGASALVELSSGGDDERAALPVADMLACAFANLPLALNESEVSCVSCPRRARARARCAVAASVTSQCCARNARRVVTGHGRV